MPIKDLTIRDMPDKLALFPLSGALLLPRTELPLNIFEPRYLEMCNHVLSTNRLIGIIQPKISDVGVLSTENSPPELEEVGCVGRITSFAEQDDGRILISLVGVCRFEILKEKKQEFAWREAYVSYSSFLTDFHKVVDANINLDDLIHAFKLWLDANHLKADWAELRKIDAEGLINTLAMVLELDETARQGLLEARDFKMRAELLLALIERSSLTATSNNILQ